jgi:hypothetical protein
VGGGRSGRDRTDALGDHLPLYVVGRTALGWTIGACFHLLVGVPAGLPRLDTARAALTRVGVEPDHVEPLSADARGSAPFVVTAGARRLFVNSRTQPEMDALPRVAVPHGGVVVGESLSALSTRGIGCTRWSTTSQTRPARYSNGSGQPRAPPPATRTSSTSWRWPPGARVTAEAQATALSSEATRRNIALPSRFDVPDPALWEKGYGRRGPTQPRPVGAHSRGRARRRRAVPRSRPDKRRHRFLEPRTETMGVLTGMPSERHTDRWAASGPRVDLECGTNVGPHVLERAGNIRHVPTRTTGPAGRRSTPGRWPR